MSHEIYFKEFQVVKDRFDNDLQNLGLKIRNNVVLPACKKHGLQFYSGNGIFFFCKGNTIYQDVLDPEFKSAPKKLYNDLEPILNLLNTRITHDDYLGYYVGDVR